jgi:hypothetical protein
LTCVITDKGGPIGQVTTIPFIMKVTDKMEKYYESWMPRWFCSSFTLQTIISLRGEVWVDKTNLTPPLFLHTCLHQARKMSVMYLCDRCINFIFPNFSVWNCSDSMVFLFFTFHFVIHYIPFWIFLNDCHRTEIWRGNAKLYSSIVCFKYSRITE